MDTVFSYRFNAANASAYFSVFARGSGGWQNEYRPRNGYGLELSSSSSTVSLLRNANGTVTTLRSVSGARQVSTAKQWVRLRVDGQTIQFKTWVDGQAEPTAWSATLTDAAVSAAGQLHFSLVRGGSNTGLKNVQIDDLRVTDTATATRDTTAPSAPTGLASSGVSQTQATLTWNAATDDRGVTGYQVVRNGIVLPLSVSGLTYTDTGLASASTYTYTVRAVDAAGNVGGDSNAVTVTTTAADPSLFSDTFTGADGSAWGSGWVTNVGNGSATRQSGTGELAVTNTSGAFSRSLLSGLAARTNSDTLFSYRFNAASASAYFSVFARGSGGWQNEYRPRNGYGLEFSASSSTVLLLRNVNGTLTTLRSVSGARQVSTGKQWVRLRVSGQTVQFKTWVDGQTEPTAWSATLTDTAVSAAGQLHFSLVRGSSNTGSKNVQIDDLRITDTQ